MNKHLYIIAFLAAGTVGLSACGPAYVVHQDPPPVQAPPPPPPPPVEPAPEVSYQSFYDQLSPYGQWIDDPNYGYVFLPNAGPDFKPYATNGHWVYTDAGWAWSSNYPWGWATFHYGRWFFRDGYGWMWMPGNEWAPAWVSWRSSSDYYGWAPLGPSVNINVSFGGGYNPPSHYWCFVPHQYVGSPRVANYYVNEQRNVTIINNTTVINNTVINNNNTTINNTNIRNTNINNTRIVNNYASGPDPNEVSRYSGAPVRAIPVRASNTPGETSSNNSFAIYRPRVVTGSQPAAGGNNNFATRPAPTRVQTLNNARPVNTTSYSNGYNNNAGTINNGNTGSPVFTRPAGNTQPGTVQPGSQTGFNQPGGMPSNNRPGAPSATGTNPSWRTTNQPAGQQPASQPGFRSVNQTSNQPAGQPVTQPGQPVPQSGQNVFRPTNQPNQPVGQPGGFNRNTQPAPSGGFSRPQSVQPVQQGGANPSWRTNQQVQQPGGFNRTVQPVQQGQPAASAPNRNAAPVRQEVVRPQQQQQPPRPRNADGSRDGNKEPERNPRQQR